MKKRILASLMSLCLLVGLLPTAALAAEDSGADSNPLVCTTDEGCAAEIHEENCPLYKTPDEENGETLVLEPAPAEVTPTEEDTLVSAPTNTEGDKTVPGWVDENDGHPKYVRETFDFVEENIAYSKISDTEVEVAPWYWSWKGHNCAQHADHVFAGTEYSNRETLTIPKEITHSGQTYQVVGIGDDAFYNMTGTEVTLSEGLTYIGAGAFGYSTCKTIKIPASVTRLDKEALHGDFTSITFAEGSKLESIGTRAFYTCNITELTLPNTVKSLGSTIFDGCDKLKSVVIPASVTDIQTDTFDEYFDADANDGLGNVTFAEGSIFRLQDGVLYDSENLIRVLDWQENVVVPEGIKYIGADAFNAYSTQTPNNMETLKSITLPESLVSIGKNAFQACKKLESISIPQNVTELGASAFLGCTSLKTVTIQGPIKELDQTFSGCTSLETITLPDSLEIIGTNTFAKTKIKTFDFSNIREIGNGAFEATGIKSLTNADRLERIGQKAFNDCTSLEIVILPETVKELPTSCFRDCGIKLMVLPAALESLGSSSIRDSFAQDGSLIMLGTTPPTIKTPFGSSGSKPESLAVYYPAVADAAYKENASALVGENDNGGYALDLTDASMILASAAKAADANTLTLKTVTVPEGMTLTAASDKENVATVAVSEGNLVVTGVAEGTADITATLKVGDYVVLEDTCTVTVTAEGAVIPSVEEPDVQLDKSITGDDDKKAVEAAAKSVEADKTISDAAKSEADKLTNNASEKERLEQAAKDKGLTVGDDEQVTLYTQSFLEIKAESIEKQDNDISKITLNITPKVQVVASTATNSADIDIKTTENEDGNAVVVKDPEPLTITTSSEITVQLPASFANNPVYVKHEASNGGTYFYTANADNTGKITFTSQHGFSPFTFSLTNEAVAEVDDVGYPSFQAAVDAAEDNDTVTVLKNEDLTATISGSSRTITVENKTGDKINVSINGETFQVADNATHKYTYTRPSSGGGSSGSTRYTVSVEDADNGTVKVSPSRASKGSTVTITVKPDEGYELDKLVVTDKNGDKVKLTDKGDGKYTFKMPSSKVTVEATFAEIGTEPETPVFTDVSTSAYYYDAVMWAVENGVTEGTSAATFSPDMSCTRAQIVTFLWRANGSPVVDYAMNFTDVPADAYYADAVRWAVSKGITSGTSAATFAPDMTVTRGQTVTFMYRAAGAPAVSGGSFADVAADAYYADAVAWAVKEGITSGTGGNSFSPDAPCTRGQIVTFLYRDAK